MCETVAEKKQKGAEKEEEEIDELEAIVNELERLQVPMKTVMGAVYRMQVEPKHIKLFWRLCDSAKVPMKTVMGAVYRMQVEPKHIKLFWRLRDSAKQTREKLTSSSPSAAKSTTPIVASLQMRQPTVDLAGIGSSQSTRTTTGTSSDRPCHRLLLESTLGAPTAVRRFYHHGHCGASKRPPPRAQLRGFGISVLPIEIGVDFYNWNRVKL
ncbi:hypothetical protein Tsubulata_012703 [Turnera subulata]|uniref:Uncharacterized protein n=1 Tax=Turnera subulata TaxID=218843 RepID=A0A9Q0JGG5_9ROSI|nr:hypothetical protein Tsubulata_012703 [Turnera subulata]